MTEASASNITTHYYKLAHLVCITYSIYVSKGNDQSLLDSELSIRYNNPNILITYYNKSLYYFTFNQDESIDLSKEYPDLQLKFTNTVNSETLSNPPKNTNNDDYLPFASLSFLKSIKKMILFNLSRNEMIKIFGNYSVINRDELNHILYLDPILLPNGDLLVSTIINNQLHLFDSSVLTLSNPDLNFIIYLIPSGIRCHLFDTNNFSKNFITKKSNDDNLISLIKQSVGIDYSSDEVLWVKLIPNLKHLNNQTSKISKFIHSVENKKFILWPWKLCLLQFGYYEDNVYELPFQLARSFNPLNLVSDFIDFNITSNHHQQTLAGSLNPLSMPSIVSTGLSSNGPLNLDQQKDINSVDINDIAPMVSDIFNLQNTDTTDFFEKDLIDTKDEIKEEVEDNNEDDMEIDDLFGDGSDLDEISENLIENQDQPSAPLQENNHELSQTTELEIEQQIETSEQNSHPIESNNDKLDELFDILDRKDFKEPKPTFIDIPKDQMTIKKTNTPIYNDPGAPLPIIPTPIIPQVLPTSAHSTNPPSSSAVVEEPTKSVFSPILFNPIIKSNIDTKYGKGGKFYVDKELSIDPDLDKKRTLRATSVSGFELPSKEFDYDKNISSEDSSEDSSEESDEDEETNNISNSPPLKLNTFAEPFVNQSASFTTNPIPVEKSNFNLSDLNTGGFASPTFNSIIRFSNQKTESPFFANDTNQSFSPVDYDQTQTQAQNQQTSTLNSSVNDKEEEAIKSMSESSNYLPLILRNINISTIPNFFLLNNLVNNTLLPTFNINDDDNDNDFDSPKNNEMIIKVNDLNDFLKFLAPNLIFDLGLNNFKENLKIVNNFKMKDTLIDYDMPDVNFETNFLKVFPNAYKVNLVEFLNDFKDYENIDDLDNQLNFLDDITNNDDILNPRSQFKKLSSIEWDSINLTEKNKENYNRYRSIIQQLNATLSFNDNSYFKLPIIKTRVIKSDNIINLNSTGINFWKYLNFSPINNEKNFQILLISENGSFNSEFLSLLIYNYKECNFGNISRINLNTTESRSDLENINNGLLLVNKENGQSYNEIYKQTNKKLNTLVELIKLDLINKTNRFEFDRPLLLLFINFNENLNSYLQISKIFRNFKNSLNNHQLPLVKIFTKILPGSFLVKNKNNQTCLRILSSSKLSKISMNLYNQCPNNLSDKDLTKNLFTQLVKEPPSKINFKFLNSNSKEGNNSSFNDDIFLHLAYERSIDRNWCSASWSDPLGIVTFTKSWYCSATNQSQTKEIYDVGSVSGEIWNISNDLFKKLNDEIINKTSGLGGKKFLVLTRINSIIPDDELVHWKRLSVKHKDISLIVLSVNKLPKLIFSKDLPKDFMRSSTSTSQQLPQSSANDKSINENFFRNFNSLDNSPPATTGTTIVASPSNGINFHSPQQFLNAPGNFLSPQDLVSSVAGGTTITGLSSSNNLNEAELVINDASFDIIGVIPKLPLPSFNSPTRLGMKVGYLLKEFEGNYLVFEVNLLSCSNYWNINVLMKILLNQYKKLIVLNDILGIREIDGNIKSSGESPSQTQLNFEIKGLVPWHIAAVSKSLGYLTHIYVEE